MKPGGFKLWVTSAFNNCTSPPPQLRVQRRLELELRVRVRAVKVGHVVALQVAFERQILKPVFSLYRL
jgi:hypothetical protein